MSASAPVTGCFSASRRRRRFSSTSVSYTHLDVYKRQEYANVQPHSGAQANMAVFFACMQPGDTFMGLDLAPVSYTHLCGGSGV